MSVQDKTTDRIVWIDCEMTGLDIRRDALIEIAVVITDSELEPVTDGLDLLVRPEDPTTLDTMNDVVRSMHTNSGLLDELTNGHGLSLADAAQQVLDYVRIHVGEPGKAPLAGNSVGTDRAFIARDMPELDAYLHYRIIDVSSIKELSRRWYPRVYFNTPPKNGGHRALADILESIMELRYYRETLFVPQPGPDTDTTKAVAARLVAAEAKTD